MSASMAMPPHGFPPTLPDPRGNVFDAGGGHREIARVEPAQDGMEPGHVLLPGSIGVNTEAPEGNLERLDAPIRRCRSKIP